MRKHLPVLREPDGAPGSIGRRQVIGWAGAVAAAGAVPGCSSSSGGTMMMPPPPPPPPPTAFFSTAQQNALAAFADYVIPPDQQPGGAALGVVAYVEKLLTALDGKTPMIFAGGPFSGRQPYATADGAVSKNFPPDGFKDFLPLDRYRQAAWKLRLFGSDAIKGGGINDAVLGKTVGLRNQVKSALDSAISQSKVPLSTKTPAADVQKAWNSLSTDDQALFNELVVEGCFSSPEYGGNVGLEGFEICHFEGDSQPLGYSMYDQATGSYNERPDAPVSMPNPGPDPDPMDAQTEAFIKLLVTFAGGKVFF